MSSKIDGLADKAFLLNSWQGEIFTIAQWGAFVDLVTGRVLSQQEAKGEEAVVFKSGRLADPANIKPMVIVAEGAARRAVGDENNEVMKAKRMCIANGRAFKALSIKIKSRGKKKIQYLLMG